MSEAKTGQEVVAQAADNDLDNREPVALAQIVAQVVGVVVSFAIFKGYIEPTEGAFISAQAIALFAAIQALAGVIGAAVGRAKAYSPKSAATIAVVNAKAPMGTPPVLPS